MSCFESFPRSGALGRAIDCQRAARCEHRRTSVPLRACHKVIKRIEAIPEHASRRKRQTAYKRVLRVCRKAIETAAGS